MTRIIDMEVSVPRFDVGDDQAHTEPGRGAPAARHGPAGGLRHGELRADLRRSPRQGADARPGRRS